MMRVIIVFLNEFKKIDNEKVIDSFIYGKFPLMFNVFQYNNAQKDFKAHAKSALAFR